ncbi:MAG: hypothetical protein LBP55_08960 [Candidatus Adiutrix sp.]|jgi:hypothetical protein|nr:hypothetical protein [Candidatus Adiutrix sp.]
MRQSHFWLGLALAGAWGAEMICGSVAPASAASQVDFSGYYRVMFNSETNIGYAADKQPGDFTDAYFQDRLQMDLNFHPTDEITVYWRFRGPGTYGRWGYGGTGGRSGLYTQFVYGEIKQDWGTVLVGRISDDLDVYGLADLGYMPETLPVFTSVGPFDRSDVLDGIRYTYDFDNGFSIMAQYGKLGNWDEYEGGRPGPNNGGNDSDSDRDRFQVGGTYLWDGGGVSLNLLYDRNAQIRDSVRFDEALLGYLPPYYIASLFPKIQKTDIFLVNPAFAHSWGDFSVHFEGGAAWGKQHYSDGSSQDGHGYGGYLDFDYNYGPGNVTLAGWYVSGNDLDDADSGALADLVGGNFYPLLVAYNSVNSNPGGNRAAGNLNYGGHADGGAAGFANGSNPDNPFANNNANHWGIALTGNHALTDDISLHYGLGYLALVNPNWEIASSGTYNGATGAYTVTGYTKQDKDLGVEIDLGLSFQLLDNLELASGFGYMFTGDALRNRTLKGYTVSAADAGGVRNIQAVWEDAPAEDSYVWFNSLTFSF